MSMCQRMVAVALAAAIAGSAVGQDHTAGDVELIPGTAEHFGRTFEVERGELWVPMNRNAPASPLIQLHFVRYKSFSPDPGPPIVFLAGGPGGSGIGTMESSRARAFLAMLDEHAFIAFDQRGTGYSEPAGLDLAVRIDIPLDQPADPDAMCELAQDLARRTLAMLRENDIDPNGLTTEQSADDLDALREAVGAEKLILWGSSYGTHLGLAAARRHPDKIAALILAGTEGPDHTFKLPSNIDDNLKQLAAVVTRDPVYAELMPDFLGTVEGVLADLEREPRTVTLIPGLDVVVTKWDLQKALSNPMGSRNAMQQIPAAIYAMSHGEFFDLARITLGERRVGPINGMSLCMDCSSWATDERLALIEREAVTAILGGVIDFPFPCMCEVEGMPRLPDDFRTPLESDIPTLFISGTIDGRTPVSNAEEIAAGFSNHQHLIIRDASHGTDLFLSSPAIVASVKAFLRGETLTETEIDGPEWAFQPPRQRSLEREMVEVLIGEGYDAAVARYRQIREEFEGKYVYDFREEVLNDLGYAVMRGGVRDVDLAIEVFRLNTVAYPEAFNAWDSLAEGYLEKGDFDEARKNYRKSLELNPGNMNAMTMLEQIGE